MREEIVFISEVSNRLQEEGHTKGNRITQVVTLIRLDLLNLVVCVREQQQKEKSKQVQIVR